MTGKPVYFNGAPIGSASNWHEVAALLSKVLRSSITVRDAQNHGSEGPDGFYVKMRR
ncbi:MAG: hypothetical protein ACLQJR_04515 [Stellaceae bacterium]